MTAAPFPRLAFPMPFPLWPGVGAPALPKVSLFVRLAFYLFVFSIPFEMPERSIPVETTTLTGAVFLLISIASVGTVYRRIPRALLWFAIYLWMFGFSTLWNRSEHLTTVVELFLTMLQLVLLMWAGSNVLRDPRAMRGALLVFSMACLVRASMQVLGIGTSIHVEWSGGYRTTVLGQNPNHSAIIMAAGLVAVLNLRPRLIAWLMAGIIGVALIQTGSRGGFM